MVRKVNSGAWVSWSCVGSGSGGVKAKQTYVWTNCSMVPASQGGGGGEGGCEGSGVIADRSLRHCVLQPPKTCRRCMDLLSRSPFQPIFASLVSHEVVIQNTFVPVCISIAFSIGVWLEHFGSSRTGVAQTSLEPKKTRADTNAVQSVCIQYNYGKVLNNLKCFQIYQLPSLLVASPIHIYP